jgi:hypothetical protein
MAEINGTGTVGGAVLIATISGVAVGFATVIPTASSVAGCVLIPVGATYVYSITLGATLTITSSVELR